MYLYVFVKLALQNVNFYVFCHKMDLKSQFYNLTYFLLQFL